MFSDETYLKLFVSDDEPWDVILRQMYAKRMPKKEVLTRIAYTVVNASKGKIVPGREAATLAACDTFVQFNSSDWVKQYKEIIKDDDTIVKIRTELRNIPYYDVDSVLLDSKSIFFVNRLQEAWNLTKEEAAAEICMYGMSSIGAYFGHSSNAKKRWFGKLKGRYHFVRDLHKFADTHSIDLIKRKKSESSIISNTLQKNENI